VSINNPPQDMAQGLTGQKSTSCGGDQRLKSAAYVSAPIEVYQLQFIDDYICKA
jgi:hypothetical protein